MKIERLTQLLEQAGGKNVSIREAHTMNHPNDPEGHRLAPIHYPEEVKAEGLDKSQIEAIKQQVELEEMQAEQARKEAQANEIAELIKDSEIFKAEVQKGVREALKSEDVKQTIIGISKEGTVK